MLNKAFFGTNPSEKANSTSFAWVTVVRKGMIMTIIDPRTEERLQQGFKYFNRFIFLNMAAWTWILGKSTRNRGGKSWS